MIERDLVGLLEDELYLSLAIDKHETDLVGFLDIDHD